MTNGIETRTYPKVKLRTRMDIFQADISTRRAFPCSGTEKEDGGLGRPWQEGMTVRTWLAGQAVNGLAANKNLVRVGDADELKRVAEMAVALADHILASSEAEIDGKPAGIF